MSGKEKSTDNMQLDELKAGGTDWKIADGDVTFSEVIDEGGKSTVYKRSLKRDSKSIIQ